MYLHNLIQYSYEVQNLFVVRLNFPFKGWAKGTNRGHTLKKALDRAISVFFGWPLRENPILWEVETIYVTFVEGIME